jgi:hypothetical protein
VHFTIAGYSITFNEPRVDRPGGRDHLNDPWSFLEAGHPAIPIIFDHHDGATVGHTRELWQDRYGGGFVANIDAAGAGIRLLRMLETTAVVHCSAKYDAASCVTREVAGEVHFIAFRSEHICICRRGAFTGTRCWLDDPALAKTRGYELPQSILPIKARWEEGRREYYRRVATAAAAQKARAAAILPRPPRALSLQEILEERARDAQARARRFGGWRDAYPV